MNGHIRDNFNAMGPHLVVRKTADESVVSSTAFQDDDQLLMAVAANEIWRFELMLIVTGLFDIQCRFTFPSGRIDGSGWGINAGTSTIELHNLGSGSSPSLTFSGRADSTSVPRTHHLAGLLANGGSAGNFTLQWAQGTSGGTATILKTNSTLWAAKLA